MDIAGGGNAGSSGDDRENQSNRFGRSGKLFHRHSPEIIQHLEEFFKICPHPDESQRQQLSRDLGLEPKQIKFWFQNKRTQTKTRNEKVSNNALKTENEQLYYQNLTMKETMRSINCHNCESSGYGEEARQQNLQSLRDENAWLRSEYERVVSIVSSFSKPGDILPESLLTPTSKPLAYDPNEPKFTTDQEMSGTSSRNLFPDIQEMEKSVMVETAISAMGELLELLRADEPLWIRTSRADGITSMIHHETYNSRYPKMSHVSNPQAWIESSKATGIVSATAIHLVDIFQDPRKLMDFFPTIVTKSRTLDVVDTGNRGGSLQLIYEKLHVLSPFLAPREFILLQYIRQLNPTTWIMAQISYDSLKELDASSSQAWMLPSGCLVQDMSNGKSKVCWIEHAQVDDRSFTHCMYKDIVCTSQAYGAKRWLSTLERMCERLIFSMGTEISPTHEPEGAIDGPQSRRNITKISHAMVKNFHAILSMQEKSKLPQFLEYHKNGFRISLRNYEFSPNQVRTTVVCVATSVRLPTSFENLFYFFRDDNTRDQWDVLYHGNASTQKIVHIQTGSHPGNSISLLQSYVMKDNINNVILEESSIDELGASLIYAPIEFSAMASIISGQDSIEIPVLPSGFIISSDRGEVDEIDGGINVEASSSSSGPSTSRSASGMASLLTVALQIPVTTNKFEELKLEQVDTMHSLINSTIKNIRRAIGAH